MSCYGPRMCEPAPFSACRLSVPREWIDYNGHLNVGYYAVAFDKATDILLDHLGLGETYRHQTGFSMFIVESHTTYLREVSDGASLRFETRVLDTDSKRVHIFHEMHHDTEKYLAATSEMMALHIDLRARQAEVFPDDRQTAIARLAEAGCGLAWPEQCGRTIGIRRSSI